MNRKRLRLCGFLSCLFFVIEIQAQSPQGISYQAVVRDTNGLVLVDQLVELQFAIRFSEFNGVVVYEESHFVSTNKYGLVSLEIGNGDPIAGGVQASFEDINWGAANHFLSIRLDDGSGSLIEISSTQLLSVPYALYAKTTGDTLKQIDSLGIANHGYVAGAHTIDTHIDSLGIDALGFKAGVHTIDTQLDSLGIANYGYVAGAHTIDTHIDSNGIDALGFRAGAHTIDTQLDSLGIAGYGYVAGAHTIDTHIDSLGIDALGFKAGAHTIDTQLDSLGIANYGYVAGAHTIDTHIDSTGIDALGFRAGAHTIDTQLDSLGIANYGYVAGGHTVDTHIDSLGIDALGFRAGAHTIDTQLDSLGIANYGYVAGGHTVDTHIDSLGIDALGFRAGAHTIDTQLDSLGIANYSYVAGAHTVDTHIDSLGIDALGFRAGSHTIDTQLDSLGIANYGYVAGTHTVDTQIDSLGIDALGFRAGSHTIDTQLDSLGIANYGYVAGAHTVDTHIDSIGIDALGFRAGSHTIDTHIDSLGIANYGYVAGVHTVDTHIDSLGIDALGFKAGSHTVDSLSLNNSNELELFEGSNVTPVKVDLSNLRNTLDDAYNEGGVGNGRVINATDGALRVNGDDGFIVTGTYGSGSNIEVTGSGTRMFFNPKRAAFRAGRIYGSDWDDSKLGNYSVAFGSGNEASGDFSVAHGRSNDATGHFSNTSGTYNRASGLASNVFGYSCRARSFAETVLGSYSTDYSENSYNGWNASDRLFVLGNGDNYANRSDALIVYKSGNTILNGQLTLSTGPGGDSLTFPNTDGAANQVLKTDGTGNLGFVDVSSIITTPNLSSILFQGNDAGNSSIVNIRDLTINDKIQGDSSNYLQFVGKTQTILSGTNFLDLTASRRVSLSSTDSIVFSTMGINRMFIETSGNVGIGTNTPSSLLDIDGDVELGSNDAFYFGDPNTDGTWRIIRDGDDLAFQRRESGIWVAKIKLNP